MILFTFIHPPYKRFLVHGVAPGILNDKKYHKNIRTFSYFVKKGDKSPFFQNVISVAILFLRRRRNIDSYEALQDF